MTDPYVYPGTEILKNLAGIKDEELLAQMEADYTCSRLSDLVVEDLIKDFNYKGLCYMHHYIFQDIFEWAGKTRAIDIEKQEPALGGISIEYTKSTEIEKELKNILDEMNKYTWEIKNFNDISKKFSDYMARLWKIHPFREGNERVDNCHLFQR